MPAWLGVPLTDDAVFKDGVCVVSENPRVETEYRNLRWHVFRNFAPEAVFDDVRGYVFPFIKSLGGGKDTAFIRYMKNAVFLIPTPQVLSMVVDGIDAMDMNNKDIMGDVYEYLLSRIASSGELGQFRTPRHIISMMVQLMEPALEDRILDGKAAKSIRLNMGKSLWVYKPIFLLHKSAVCRAC